MVQVDPMQAGKKVLPPDWGGAEWNQGMKVWGRSPWGTEIFSSHMSPKSRSFSNHEGLAIQQHIKWAFLPTFCVDSILKVNRETHSENAQAWMLSQHWFYFGNISAHSAALYLYFGKNKRRLKEIIPAFLPCTLHFRLKGGLFWAGIASKQWLVN